MYTDTVTVDTHELGGGPTYGPIDLDVVGIVGPYPDVTLVSSSSEGTNRARALFRQVLSWGSILASVMSSPLLQNGNGVN